MRMRSTSSGDHAAGAAPESRVTAAACSASSRWPTSSTVICWVGSTARARAVPAAAGPEPMISVRVNADRPGQVDPSGSYCSPLTVARSALLFGMVPVRPVW